MQTPQLGGAAYASTDHTRLWEHLNRVRSDVNAALLDAFAYVENYDPVAAGDLTAAAGWSISEARCVVFGPIVQLYLVSTRTGAAIASQAVGNIANQTVANIADASLRPMTNQVPMMGVHTGILVNGYAQTSGIIGINAVSAGQGIANGETVSLGGVWLADL